MRETNTVRYKVARYEINRLAYCKMVWTLVTTVLVEYSTIFHFCFTMDGTEGLWQHVL